VADGDSCVQSIRCLDSQQAPIPDVQAAVYWSATVFADGDCFYRLSEENMGIVIKDRNELFIRLIDGDFPDYTKLIPNGNQNIARTSDESCKLHIRASNLLTED
jgi:DNA polymerase III sliding clamp (beta) subunit (PCNA family)